MRPLHVVLGSLVPFVIVACAGAAPAPAPAPVAAMPVAPSAAAGPAGASAAGPGEADAASASATDAAARATGEAVPGDGGLADRGEGVATSSGTSASASACNEQAPQDFLVRANFLRVGAAGLARAIQYRTDTYGYFKGFGHAAPDAEPPSHFLVDTTFMNLPVKMHRKVAPALACVEEEIKRSCADHPYKAHALAGIRFRNTYRGGEITNHIYGIAIDIDPSINTCCGCVKPWSDSPVCQKPAKTEYDRMAMPECWVHAFERYGFYWLGHDVLRDTMHFEFLGDPDKILKNPPVASGPTSETPP
jgi:hypothetical protein